MVEKPTTEFWQRYEAEGPDAALQWFYDKSIADGFVHNIGGQNLAWATDGPWGPVDITINRAKPEKDPKAIAAAAKAKADNTCVFCDPDKHLKVDVPLRGEQWTLHYSPYGYFPEHSIVASPDHVPMSITPETFGDLLDLVEAFPGYFFGSNADLPIVGGSILAHNHYQGGRTRFPLDDAPVVRTIELPAFPGVQASLVRWPLSVVRLEGADRAEVQKAAVAVLNAWRNYSNDAFGILDHEEDGTPHNTVTPIARRLPDGRFRLDLVLRNNRTDEAHPLGIFHPHEEVWKVKKENIGLIEAMGQAILPPRIESEFDVAEEGEGRDEVGALFTRGLEHCGVFPASDEGQDAFEAFVTEVGAEA